MKTRNGAKTDKIDLQMTPMIDIMFQLLVFFIMTFNIVESEGDFGILLPGAPAEKDTSYVPPVKLRLKMTANSDGALSEVKLNGTVLDSSRPFAALHQRILGMFDDGAATLSDQQTEYEVEMQCDYNLKYDNVIQAITAVSGYKKQTDGEDEIVRLINKIRFAQPANALE